MTYEPANLARPSGRLHVGIYLHGFAHTGGASQAILGLIRGLGKLDDGAETYSIIVQSEALREWLQPHCGPIQRIVLHGSGKPQKQSNSDRVLRAALTPVMPLARAVKRRLTVPRRWPEVPVSDGFVESLGCDVIHFPAYWFMLCNVPSVYNPHDLQHRMYPQYISQDELLMRETLFPEACRLSHAVVVGTQWVKDDVIRHFRLDPEKLQIIPWASPTEFYREPSDRDLRQIAEKYGLSEPFGLLPANTWPHKNHVGLLDALAHLRDTQNLRVRVVCTGVKIAWYWPTIEARLKELELESQVKFLGSVPSDDLRALYRLSQFMVMPTLYEADSNPIHEAWHEDVPVASSNVTALPDQVKDAGVLFDPRDIESMADALRRIATDEDLRNDLRQRGRRRLKDFSWERTAKAYRAVYRRVSQRRLTEEDRWLLQWDWLRDPDRSAPQNGGSPS